MEEAAPQTQQQQSQQQQQGTATREIGGLVFLNALDLVPVEEYRYIGAVEWGKRLVSIGVDSGAAASVWPTGLCSDYPTRRSAQTGTQYATAGNNESHLVNEGERSLVLKMGDGSLRGTKMQVTGVRKPLMSVADMVDAGNDVHFLASGESYSIHRQSGVMTKFVRRRNVFEIDAEVPQYQKLKGLQRMPLGRVVEVEQPILSTMPQQVRLVEDQGPSAEEPSNQVDASLLESYMLPLPPQPHLAPRPGGSSSVNSRR